MNIYINEAVSILEYLYILKKIKMPSKKSECLAKIIMQWIESILWYYTYIYFADIHIYSQYSVCKIPWLFIFLDDT